MNTALEYLDQCARLAKAENNEGEYSVVLGETARIHLTRGDLDRALSLYQESLQLKEQLGDKQGKGTSLSMLGNLYMMRDDLVNAEKVILESLQIAYDLGFASDIAFNTIKLGQVAQARGDKQTAMARFREGLTIFERMGMPEADQVRRMIASVGGSSSLRVDNPLTETIAQARSAAERGDIRSAIQYQERAVALARGAGQGHEALVTLSVMIYNLAGYYQNAERYEDAVKAMEEVVAIDEQTGHEDLESDRTTLEVARRIASMSPEERAALQEQGSAEENEGRGDERDGFEAQLQAQLSQLPPEQRAQAEAQIRKAFEEFQRMTPEQQAAVMDQSRRAQIDNAANQARDAALAYFRKQTPRKDILDFLDGLAQKAAEGEEPGSPWLDVAALCNSLVALIKEEMIPPVPAKYVAHFSAVQQEMKS